MDRFSALPSELRDKVYRELLCVDRFTFLSNWGLLGLHLPITAVSRLIHTESVHILHNENFWVSIQTRERSLNRYTKPMVMIYMREILPMHIQPPAVQLTLIEAHQTREQVRRAGLGPSSRHGPLRTFTVVYDALFDLSRCIRDVCLVDITESLSSARMRLCWPVVWINFRRASNKSERIVNDLAKAFEEVNHVYPILISPRVFDPKDALWYHTFEKITNLPSYFQDEIHSVRERIDWYNMKEKELLSQRRLKQAMCVLHHHLKYYLWIGEWPLLHPALARLTREPNMTIWQDQCSAASCKLASFCLDDTRPGPHVHAACQYLLHSLAQKISRVRSDLQKSRTHTLLARALIRYQQFNAAAYSLLQALTCKIRHEEIPALLELLVNSLRGAEFARKEIVLFNIQNIVQPLAAEVEWPLDGPKLQVIIKQFVLSGHEEAAAHLWNPDVHNCIMIPPRQWREQFYPFDLR